MTVAWLALIIQQPVAIDIIADIRRADAFRFAAKDNLGVGLDCLKIVQAGPKRYFGVYHSLQGDAFELRLVESTDLLTWTYRTTLDTHAHQGTLMATKHGILLAHEKDSPEGNWIRLRRFTDWAALAENRSNWTFDIPRRLSRWAEGTPSIRSADWSADGPRIELSFHYLTERGIDRQAQGSLDGTFWRAYPDTWLNARIDQIGVKGNFGDRDHTEGIELYEAQWRKYDWATWRIFAREGDQLRQLRIRTPAGSTSFANPTVTKLKLPDGSRGFVWTLFLPSEGARGGEAGCMIAYRSN